MTRYDKSQSRGIILAVHKNGTFQPGVAYPISVGGGNSDLITADLNGDKILDLVVSGTYGTAVLIGAKGGTFGTSTIYKYGGGSAAVADMNKDGKLDLIAGPNGTCSYGCQVSVLLGNGDGTFGTVVSTPVYGNFTGLSLVTGDFNHDGRTDIAFGGGWAGIEVLLGNGAGGFNTPFHAYGSFTTVQYGGPILLTGDYNLDGQLDLVSLPYPFTGQSFSILSGNGDGTFGAEQDLAAGSGPSTVVTGDFNNDGKLDLAVTSGFTSGTGVGVFLGKGNGTFKPALVTVETSAAGPMVSGDFNHDGKLDLASVNKDNTVSSLLGTGTGAFTAAHTYSVSKTGAVSAIAAADFNHDGNFDLVLVDTLHSTAWVLLGNSDGTFQNATSWNTYYGGCYSVAVADLNGDGNPDIAATCGYTYISLLFGNGDGTFSSPSVVYDPSAGNSGFNVALADLQGNGVYDLIGSHLNNLWVALGAGNGGFPSSWIQNWGGGYSESLGTPTAIADFNNDGKVDIAEAGLNSFAAVAFGNGDGTFQPEMMYAVPLNVWNGNAYSVVLGDFNNDGSLDMAVASSGRTGTVTVILSNPVAVFSAAKLVFGKVTTGSSSALELTVTDQSPTKLTIKGITISGKGASEYSQTNTCGTVVTPYGSCTVTVRFSPSAIGTQNALLNFADSAAGKTRTISLVGTGQ